MIASALARSAYAFGVLVAWTSLAAADEPKKQAVLEAVGYVVPVRQVAVSSEMAGKVQEILFKEGQQVKKGEVLARVDDTLVRYKMQRAEAQFKESLGRLALLKAGPPKEEIAAARAEVDLADAVTKAAEADFKRAEALFTRGSLSRADFDERKAAFTSAQGRLDKGKRSLEILQRGSRPEEIAIAEAVCQKAEAELNLARYHVENAIIRAPFDGTILSQKVEVGSYVNPTAFNYASVICYLANLRELEAEINVQERDLGRIMKGQRCRLRATAFPNVVYQGEVSRLSPVGNRAIGALMVRVRITIPEKEENLRPDLSVVVEFLPKE